MYSLHLSLNVASLPPPPKSRQTFLAEKSIECQQGRQFVFITSGPSFEGNYSSPRMSQRELQVGPWDSG